MKFVQQNFQAGNPKTLENGQTYDTIYKHITKIKRLLIEGVLMYMGGGWGGIQICVLEHSVSQPFAILHYSLCFTSDRMLHYATILLHSTRTHS